MSASAGRVMMLPQGEYSASTTYHVLDIVSYQGSSYIAKRTTIGNVPTDTTYWQPVADMSAKMDRSVYDSNNNGIVDNAERVNDHTVEKDVPADAQFTDTKTLSDMTDTDINNPTEGQTLRYNSTTRKFENGTVASSFNSLSDTNFVDLRDGQVPLYDSETSKWINADVEGLVPIVTWADGTDAQISKMLEAHYQGLIDIHDYWTVGDERVVHLSAMAATGVNESHVSQDIIMVLMNEGGKTLATPINGISECAFIVGQKGFLSNSIYLEDGYINSTPTNAGGWDSSARRTWCNNVYRAALPETIRDIFKQHKNITSQGSPSHSTPIESIDYFALPSEKEIFGAIDLANATAEANTSQFEYYETMANRIKWDYNNQFHSSYYLRSPRDIGSNEFIYVDMINQSPTPVSSEADVEYSISPFGVI